MSATDGTDGAAPLNARIRLIAAAAKLFQEKGYAATGLSDILTAASAPKGSLYHHFPDGKAELGAAAMKAAGAGMVRSLRACRAQTETAEAAIRAYGELLAGWLEQSDFTRGCPVATVALEEAPGSGPVAIAARDALAATEQALMEILVADGLPEPVARRRAGHGLAALEGSLILARLSRDARPVRDAADDVASLVEQAKTR
jgi:TetR/AcrR family transcriptional repressor of lmrAB and yxaGH operons